MDSHERYAHKILTEIADDRQLSQRSLARGLGIALGLTNLLVRRLVRKGWVRVIRIRSNRVRYLLTPSGFTEKTRMSRVFLQDSVRFYTTARDRIRNSLSGAVVPSDTPSGAATANRIIFYGAGEVAEIAYICLQETDLKLVGVVGETAGRPFFGVPVHSGKDVRDGFLGSTPFDRLVVTSFEDLDAKRAELEALGVNQDRVCWL